MNEFFQIFFGYLLFLCFTCGLVYAVTDIINRINLKYRVFWMYFLNDLENEQEELNQVLNESEETNK